jgi:hypothetical protein
LRNMSSSLVAKELDVVGAVSSSIRAKYNLHVAVIRILVGVGVCSITRGVSLPRDAWWSLCSGVLCSLVGYLCWRSFALCSPCALCKRAGHGGSKRLVLMK